jgi:hypothetical protein
MRGRLHSVGVVFLLAVILTPRAANADTPPSDDQLKANCGTTIADALKEAQRLLTIAYPQTERGAIGCLIRATTLLQGEEEQRQAPGTKP